MLSVFKNLAGQTDSTKYSFFHLEMFGLKNCPN